MKPSLRLILFTKCNLACSYCCNENPDVNSRFIQKSLHEIDFYRYGAICLTGGEPFLNPSLVFEVLIWIPVETPVYIYTNGLLLTTEILRKLGSFENVKGLNIGLHHVNQLNSITPLVDKWFPVRYLIQDTRRDEFVKRNASRLTVNNTKTWILDQCDIPNEEWILLKGETHAW